ncbi:sn-glycerol-3-phosphate ABC transporter ATP-binding protein UgpC [Herbaspirillum huttiense F1]|uniref:Sn-glycerol-3-phosphate ABC transporter ATP-binding protein UgpC n=3 Tax=Herbaspirillum huttiense TaxID=863372 RepID=A0AAJ2H937_9BURK|nr:MULTISPECIES: sn-glycerol-3-phosphate ABC transporter ATP-binding protein UgpC [Herbaspirillum]MBP1314611.1 multiple sugar transport system ATP-binding protein [Herbaspirillum sp. 1130]MDR6741760.1 multiple sugar transport system ATP-binding protein [Herbaspirillum sp. 1173]MDR9836352.1 sn-glycerol-3-phosphate ABC transporter ATP-binding protein UgpC [Herbaspirillum huttiense]MDR9849970.1 sn-glycerol-3-phosphate ABC transporter ATP-binding protein UgpC [Herbaspirillum huttiense SE1]MDT03586
MASISLRAAQKAYGDAPPVIRNVDLDIGEHEFCVFLGPSGCGKSTLLRSIAGLEDLTSGDLFIGGKRVNDVPSAQRSVAMVFQSYALFPHMTVYENMSFGLTLAKLPKAEIEQKVREAARILQLEELLQRKPKELSGGQRQRVAIGRAIVRRPGVFLFDEPLSNLDATLRSQTRIEIARLHRQFEQASVVYVTHDQVEAMTLADRIVLLHAGADTQRFGSIAQVGAPMELYHHPRNRFVAGFIGSPRMNFLPAQVVNAQENGILIRLQHSEETLLVAAKGPVQPGQQVTLGVRPEHMEIGSQGQYGITREVMLVERLGEQTYVHLDEPAGQPLVAKAPGDAHIARGERLRVSVAPSCAYLFDADGVALARTQVHPGLAAAA